MKNKRSIVWCRVSTHKQAQYGESLEDQELVCSDIAKRNGWNNLKIWKDAYSGRETDSPVYAEMMEYVKANKGKIDYLLIRHIDRLTRAGVSQYLQMKSELAKYGVELIDSYGIIQPKQNTLEHLGYEYDWSSYSPSETTEILLANASKDEARTILTRMIGQEIRLASLGYQVRRANDGYVNDKIIAPDGKKRTIQVPHPVRAKYYIKMFEMRASGNNTDEEIVKAVNAEGFKTPKQNVWNNDHTKVIGSKGKNPLSVKTLQKAIKNTRYCGIVCEKWTQNMPIKAPYDGLVSIELFNKANRGKVFIKELESGNVEILYDYNPNKVIQKRLKNNPDYPYKNVVLCPLCKDKTFLGSASKGKSGQRFPKYHCARKHKYLGIKKDEFEQNIKDFVKSLKFDSSFLKTFEAVLMDKFRERQKELLSHSLSVSKNVTELKQQKEHVLDNLLSTTNETVKKELEKRIDKLEQGISQAQDERNTVEISEYDIQTFINFAKFLMEHPARLLLNSENELNVEQHQEIFSLLFNKLPTYDQIVNHTPDLSLVFATTKPQQDAEALLVTYCIENWNTIIQHLKHWSEALPHILKSDAFEITL